MRLVLGLGNPGERYRGHRHNVGARVVECLSERSGARLVRRKECHARMAETRFGAIDVVLAIPAVFMNLAGRSAGALIESFAAAPSDLLVVHDDADLQFGRVRIRAGGGAGGHNGLRSLMAALRTAEFPRVKLGVRGIGRDERELADYVLDTFSEGEADEAERMVLQGADAVEAVLREGLSAAMNRFNGPDGGGKRRGTPEDPDDPVAPVERRC